jgi:nucleotide-binding universal stress UspA family protein
MTMEAKVASNNNKIHMKKILVPVDSSEYSLTAAKYAIRIAKRENAQLFCIHVMVGIPYGYTMSASATDQYFSDMEEKVESWFDKVRDMAKHECIPELKTEIFTDVKSIIESIIDYATSKNEDLIVNGTKGRTGLKRFLLGSVANGIVQHDHCPVLLVR